MLIKTTNFMTGTKFTSHIAMDYITLDTEKNHMNLMELNYILEDIIIQEPFLII